MFCSVSTSCCVLWSLTTKKFVFFTNTGNNLLVLEILNRKKKKALRNIAGLPKPSKSQEIEN